MNSDSLGKWNHFAIIPIGEGGLVMALKAVVSDLAAEKKTVLENHNLPLVHLVASPQDQAKNRLREAISRNLTDPLRIPEVIEGLVEYLVEVLPNDPGKTKLWGV